MQLHTRHRGKKIALAAAVAGGLALGGLGVAIGTSAPDAPVGALEAPSPNGFAELAERVQPAVVFVTVNEKAPTSPPDMRLPPPSWFEGWGAHPHMFGQRGERHSEGKRRHGGHGMQGRHGMREDYPRHAPRARRGVGSGFFIDREGHVVTSDHVVARAEEITVTTHDGERHPARVVGRDPRTDLAVLKIESGAPPAWLEFGDDGEARVGDWVVAIGNPFGLGGTVTAGILSARGRDIRLGGYGDFLQVDAPINRGNSGGPLFDTRGRVIGVNAAIYAPSGGNVGIGFAVPSGIASPVVASLIETGKVTRGWLGVSLQALTPELGESLGLETSDGVLVAGVASDSPAERAGIERADVVTAVDGRAMEDGRMLARAVGDMKPGAKLNLTVWRDGKEREITVELDEWPDEGELAAATGEDMEAAPARGGPRIGVRLSRHADGRLVIERVRPGSAAARARLEPGDVLLEVDREPVRDVAAVRRALRDAAKAEREHALLLIERRGTSHFVAVPLEVERG